eukprot:15271569-Alexandrium_andersonii.AAC.1
MRAAATWAERSWPRRRGASSRGTHAAARVPEGSGRAPAPSGPAARKTRTVLTYRTGSVPGGDP